MREIEETNQTKKKKKKSRCERRKKELGHLSTKLRSLLRSVLRCLQTSWLATNCRAILRPNDWAHKHIFSSYRRDFAGVSLEEKHSHGLLRPLALFLDSIETIAHVNEVGREDADPTRWLVRPVVLQTKRHSFVVHLPSKDRFPAEFNDLTLIKINNKKRKTLNEI